jgi:hypothetical protein
MSVIAEQGPRVTGGGASQQQLAKPINKVVPISIISEDYPLFDPPDNNMVERPWSVYS